MQDLNDLYYFVHVVDHGGFAPAGRALGVPKSKLSRRIALLEERLGVRLIQRSSRRFNVTEPGQAYYAHAKAALVEVAAAEDAILRQGSEPRGTVRMSCPITLLDTDVGPMVAEFLSLHPQVSLHLDATNRVPLDVAVGDKVIYSKYGGTEVKYAGEEYLVLSARDVLAVVVG